MDSQPLKWVHFILAGVLIAMYFLIIAAESVIGAILIFPFVMSPIMINVLASKASKSITAQIILLLTTLSYSGWAVYLVIDSHGIAILHVAILASPGLLILWLICIDVELRYRRKRRHRYI